MALSSSDIETLLFKIAYRDDQIAFRTLFDYYFPLLDDFARYILKSPPDAEEVVVDVFVKIWNARIKLVEVKKLHAYLYTITKREALNRIRKNRINTQLYVQYDDQFQINHITPEHEFLGQEAIQKLAQVINELPTRCRLVFQMVKENGLKYKEVARILNISEKAVEVHMIKALKSIKDRIAENPSKRQKEGVKNVDPS